jgi:hypothetical protein
VGDEIWICPGSKFPLATRPTLEKNHHELVGAVYVHGFMFGYLAESGLVTEDVYENLVLI